MPNALFATPAFFSSSTASATSFFSWTISRLSAACSANGANSSHSSISRDCPEISSRRSCLPDELVRRDLLEELDGAERAVVHAVLVDDVTRARVGLEARLQRERARASDRATRGCAAWTTLPNGSPPAGAACGAISTFGVRGDFGIATEPEISEGGSIDIRTSTSTIEIRDMSASGGGMLFIGARWCIALASAPRSSGRCAGSPTSAFDRSSSSASGRLGSISRGRRIAGPIDAAGQQLVEHRADREDARARVAGRERTLQLRRETRAVVRVRRNDRELRLQAREPVGARRDARRVHVDALAAIVTLFQIEAERNDDRDRLVERELHALSESLVDEGPQGHHHDGGRRAPRHACRSHPIELTARRPSPLKRSGNL